MLSRAVRYILLNSICNSPIWCKWWPPGTKDTFSSLTAVTEFRTWKNWLILYTICTYVCQPHQLFALILTKDVISNESLGSVEIWFSKHDIVAIFVNQRLQCNRVRCPPIQIYNEHNEQFKISVITRDTVLSRPASYGVPLCTYIRVVLPIFRKRPLPWPAPPLPRIRPLVDWSWNTVLVPAGTYDKINTVTAQP